MKILIIEDEPAIANYIEDMCRAILGTRIQTIRSIYSLEEAMSYLSSDPVDLCLLDLNLNGENGFDILKDAVSGSFHTIIVSAHTDQAIHAFEYGVLDFISKPFDEERLRMAFVRYFDRGYRKELPSRFLSLKNGSKIQVIEIKQVIYFKGADNYVEAFLRDGNSVLLYKKLYRLLQILPSNFIQIHRSYIIDINQISSFYHSGHGAYQVELKNSDVLPLNRHKYKELKRLFDY